MKTGYIIVLAVLFAILLGLVAIVVLGNLMPAVPETEPAAAEVTQIPQTPEPVSEEPEPEEDTILPEEEEALPEEEEPVEEEPAGEPTGQITLGAIGDIMIMPKQLSSAFEPSKNRYDFSRSFTAVAAQFSSVDIMCGNLEGTMAGTGHSYSNGQQDAKGRIRFNAPDSLAENLKDAGFDVLTTANNHAGDYGADGIVNTIDAIRNAGLLQTGTYREADDRMNPVIVDCNGIKLGILAATSVINGNSGLSSSEKKKMFSMMQELDSIREEVRAAKEAGAEYIIMFAHWGKEYETKIPSGSRTYAKRLLGAGVDLLIGSHPHVVEPFEYMTVKRDDGSSYTGLVIYSLGNFIANMSGESQYEMYVQIDLNRDEDGTVALAGASYMPLVCFSKDVAIPIEGAEPVTDENGETTVPSITAPVFEVVPALSDVSKIQSFCTLEDREIQLIGTAREFVMKVCGEDVLPVMEDSCWTN